MNIIGIIPARMASSRFPGKPLANINGIPMIEHVYKRCKMADILDDLYVATCDEEIFNHIIDIGGNAVMTSINHNRATDRSAEALKIIEKNKNLEYDIILMLQGDEPMVSHEMIEKAIKPMILDKSIKVVNLMSLIRTKEEWIDPNEVKVVYDKNLYALYFSREPIPSNKKYDKKIKAFKQVCVIPFRRNALMKYLSSRETNLEIIESVDMNRILENGDKIKMVISDELTLSVDTPTDLKRVEKLMLKFPDN